MVNTTISTFLDLDEDTLIVFEALYRLLPQDQEFLRTF